MAYLQSRAGIARSGVTYCGWAKPKLTFRLAGADISNGFVLADSLKIVNALDSHTSMMTVTLHGVTPVVGNDIKVTYTTPNVYEFGGTILQIRALVRPGIEVVFYECTATGYLWMMDRGESTAATLVMRRYLCGANTAVADILARFTNGGFRVGYIPSSLGDISMNFDMVRVSEAITAIATVVRGYWEVTADRVVSMYAAYPESTLPTITNTTTLFDEMELTTDLTQVRTRTYYRGGGGTALSAVDPGGTSIQVSNLEPFASKRTQEMAGQITSGQNLLTVSTYSGRIGPGTITLVDPVVYRIEAGDAVTLFAPSTGDATAETDLATTLGEGSGVVIQVINGSGEWYDEAVDRAQGDENIFKTAVSEFIFTTLNREVRPGRVIPISMTIPFVLTGSLRIQEVEITTRGVVTSSTVVFYRRVTTSPWRVTLTNMLRGVQQIWPGKEF
jgi:hypothetical protein